MSNSRPTRLDITLWKQTGQSCPITMMSMVAVKVLAALGIAVAGATAAAASGFAPGIATALAAVPSASHAHSVLQMIQTAFSNGAHPGSQSGHP
jgi:hypothetical protein